MDVRLIAATNQNLIEQVKCHHFRAGNVRELEHLISRAVLKASSEVKGNTVATVTLAHLGLDAANEAYVSAEIPPASKAAALSLRDATLAFQRRMIQQALEDHEGNLAAAAKTLNMDRGNLSRLALRVGAITRQPGPTRRTRKPRKQDPARA